MKSQIAPIRLRESPQANVAHGNASPLNETCKVIGQIFDPPYRETDPVLYF